MAEIKEVMILFTDGSTWTMPIVPAKDAHLINFSACCAMCDDLPTKEELEQGANLCFCTMGKKYRIIGQEKQKTRP